METGPSCPSLARGQGTRLGVFSGLCLAISCGPTPIFCVHMLRGDTPITGLHGHWLVCTPPTCSQVHSDVHWLCMYMSVSCSAAGAKDAHSHRADPLQRAEQVTCSRRKSVKKQNQICASTTESFLAHIGTNCILSDRGGGGASR